MYYHGLGVEKDWSTARSYYKKAAPANHNARLLLEELEEDMKKNGMKIDDWLKLESFRIFQIAFDIFRSCKNLLIEP